MPPFDAAVYQNRQNKVFARMQTRGIAALYLPPSGDLEYLTGFRRRRAAHTDIVQPADWMYGAILVPGIGTYVVAPYMVSSYVRHHVADKPWLRDVLYVPEHDDPMRFLAGLPARFGLPGSLGGYTLAVGNRIWAQSVLSMHGAFPALRLVAAGDLVSDLRQVKEPGELALMRRAAAIADAAFAAVVTKLKAGITDLEVATEVDYQLQLLGAEWTSFPTGIVFAGRQDRRGADEAREVGAPVRQTLAPGMHVSFDFGAVYQGYCSDFGRTVFCGDPDPELAAIYELIMRAQTAGMAVMRAGEATGADADRAARSLIVGAGYGDAFWHRLGHGIGIDVHEPPFLTASEPRTLQAGMTFTVEPSVLRPGAAIRVEDVVLVAAGGGESFNQATRGLVVV